CLRTVFSRRAWRSAGRIAHVAGFHAEAFPEEPPEVGRVAKTALRSDIGNGRAGRTFADAAPRLLQPHLADVVSHRHPMCAKGPVERGTGTAQNTGDDLGRQVRVTQALLDDAPGCGEICAKCHFRWSGVS